MEAVACNRLMYKERGKFCQERFNGLEVFFSLWDGVTTRLPSLSLFLSVSFEFLFPLPSCPELPHIPFFLSLLVTLLTTCANAMWASDVERGVNRNV